MTSRPIRFAVVDNDWTVLAAVGMVAAARPTTLSLTQSVSTLDELDLDPVTKPEVLVLDLFLGKGNELAPAYDKIAELDRNGVAVVMFTNDPLPGPILRTINAGARGVVLKSDGPEALVTVIEAAFRGEFAVSSALANACLDQATVARLTEREIKVLELFADGLEIEGVAADLYVTPENIKKHLNNISRKYRELGRPGGGRSTIREATRDGWLRLRDRPEDPDESSEAPEDSL